MGNIWGVAAGAFVVYMIQSVVLKAAQLGVRDAQPAVHLGDQLP
jgi:hypothetical protein